MSSDIMNINVGGIKYSTSRSTLCKYPESMLGAMFSQNMPSQVDKDGYYFIDRDGEIFRYILQFLRCGELNLTKGNKDYDLLKSEVNFYQIAPLLMLFSEENVSEKNKTKEIVIICFNLSNCGNTFRWKFFCKRINANSLKICISEHNMGEYDEQQLVDDTWVLNYQIELPKRDQMITFLLSIDLDKTSMDSIYEGMKYNYVKGKAFVYSRKDR